MSAEVWISGDQQTVNGLLDRRLADDPHGEYLDVCGTKFSAAEAASAANRLANSLAAMGGRPGDRVATLVENSAEACSPGGASCATAPFPSNVHRNKAACHGRDGRLSGE